MTEYYIPGTLNIPILGTRQYNGVFPTTRDVSGRLGAYEIAEIVGGYNPFSRDYYEYTYERGLKIRLDPITPKHTLLAFKGKGSTYTLKTNNTAVTNQTTTISFDRVSESWGSVSFLDNYFNNECTNSLFAVVEIDNEGNRLYGIANCVRGVYGGTTIDYVGVFTSIVVNNHYLTNMNLPPLGYEMVLPTSDEDLTDETSTPQGYGGQGAHDHSSDTIGLPPVPSVSTSSVGFMHVYHVNAGALSTLGQYLFPSLSNIDDLESALRAIASIFAYRDNVQYVVDLHAIPVAPSDGGSAYIKVGALETEITQPIVASDYVDYDLGSISIPENFANYIDYIGTRARLFLPFVGFVDVKNEYFQSGTLSVKYRFNVIDGSFMAFVIATSSKSQLSNSVIGQYGGNACIHFPVLAQSYGALVSGLVSGAMALSGAATAASAGAKIAAQESLAATLTSADLQPDVSQSNNYNASTSFLGGREAYLIIERAVPSFAAYYNKDKGLPLNVTYPLEAVSGFTVISDIDFTGDTFATDEDLEEIRGLLADGVYM